MADVRQRYLSLLPDSPLWVETRSMLLRGRSHVVENSSRNGFVVWSEEDGSGSVAGEPEPHLLAQATAAVPELLAFKENIEHVRSLLSGFEAETATVFAAPEEIPFSTLHVCQEINRQELSMLHHLPDDLRDELTQMSACESPIVAAFDGALPVAFAYAAAATESLWAVSIDTIPSHRRQGYASSAVIHLIGTMKRRGKSAVWGALESNPPSLRLARRLGFRAVDQLWVLTRTGL